MIDALKEHIQTGLTIFEKKYDGESIYDLERDISEAMDQRFNDAIGTLPTDKDGFTRGTFKVTIDWLDEV